ncbi:MAG: hypothetical protein ACK4PR_01045 [Gammaproteobacteria bacterium]
MHLQKPSEITHHNLQMQLYRYCKQNKLTNVRRGLYVVNSTQTFHSNIINPLLVAGKATDDSVLAYHSALESHNIAYTDFNEHTYLTSVQTSDFDFQNQHYRAILNKNLNAHNLSQCIEPINIMGIKIYRTSLERTIVDVLDKPEISGGWEEVFRSLERITIFKPELTIEYAISLNKANIIAKLGYFLEERPGYLKIDAKIIKRLLSYIPKQPYYLDRKSIRKGKYIKKWQIVIPNYLLNREWEEPNNDIDY